MAAHTKRDRSENDSRAWATHETVALNSGIQRTEAKK